MKYCHECPEKDGNKGYQMVSNGMAQCWTHDFSMKTSDEIPRLCKHHHKP